jgi:hypothetical protein
LGRALVQLDGKPALVLQLWLLLCAASATLGPLQCARSACRHRSNVKPRAWAHHARPCGLGALSELWSLPVAGSAGDLETKDAAVHALWLLVKDRQKALRPEAEALGTPGTALVPSLWEVVLNGDQKARQNKV